ncbi:MAG: cupin domain-containing protein [Patescibacteria group bacterium]
MKIVHENETQKFKNSETCIATEYPLRDKDINSTFVEVLGRYPERGRVTNEKCKELAYIIDGGGKIVIEGEEVSLSEKDLIYIEPGERFYWEGDMKMIVSCHPAWYAKQHKEVE